MGNKKPPVTSLSTLEGGRLFKGSELVRLAGGGRPPRIFEGDPVLQGS